jgi:hypothetical protein
MRRGLRVRAVADGVAAAGAEVGRILLILLLMMNIVAAEVAQISLSLDIVVVVRSMPIPGGSGGSTDGRHVL